MSCPVPLLHNLKHNKVLHTRIVLLHVVTENIPRVSPQRRVEVSHLGSNFHSVVARYGFVEQPNVPQALEDCRAYQLSFDMMDTSFFVGRVTIVARERSRLARSDGDCSRRCIAMRWRRRSSSASRRTGWSSSADRSSFKPMLGSCRSVAMIDAAGVLARRCRPAYRRRDRSAACGAAAVAVFGSACRGRGRNRRIPALRCICWD